MGDRSEGRGEALSDGHRVGGYDAPVHAEDEGVLVLRLLVRAGEPLSGSIGLVHHSTNVVFRGWIDFMAAITRLRSENAGFRGHT